MLPEQKPFIPPNFVNQSVPIGYVDPTPFIQYSNQLYSIPQTYYSSLPAVSALTGSNLGTMLGSMPQPSASLGAYGGAQDYTTQWSMTPQAEQAFSGLLPQLPEGQKPFVPTDQMGTWDYKTARLNPQGESLPDSALGWDPFGKPYFGTGLKGAMLKWGHEFTKDQESVTDKEFQALKDRWKKGWTHKGTGDKAKDNAALWDALGAGVEMIGAQWTNAENNTAGSLLNPVMRGTRTGLTIMFDILQQAALGVEKGISAQRAVQEGGEGSGLPSFQFRHDLANFAVRVLFPPLLGYDSLRFGVAPGTAKEKAQMIKDGWNEGRLLYTEFYDPAVKAEYRQRVRSGEDPYLVAMELQNPWAEAGGQIFLDPLNFIGAAIKGVKNAKIIAGAEKSIKSGGLVDDAAKALKGIDKLNDAKKVGVLDDIGNKVRNFFYQSDAVRPVEQLVSEQAAIDKASDALRTAEASRAEVLKAIDDLPPGLVPGEKNIPKNLASDLAKAEKAVAKAKAGVTTAEDAYKTASGVLRKFHEQDWSIRSLSASGNRTRMTKKVGNIFTWMSRNIANMGRPPEDIMEYVGALIRISSNDLNEVKDGILTLSHYPAAAAHFSDEFLEASAFLRAVSDDMGDVNSVVRRFKSAGGDWEEIGKIGRKIIDDAANLRYPSVSQMADAADQVKSGIKVTENTKALARQYDELAKAKPGVVRIAKLHETASKPKNAINKMLGNFYFSYQYGVAMRNGMQNGIINLFDAGTGVWFEKGKWLSIEDIDAKILATHGGQMPPAVSGFQTLRQEVRAGSEKLLGVFPSGSAMMEDFEIAASKRIYWKKYRDTIDKMMVPGRGLPSRESFKAAGFSEQQVNKFTRLVKDNYGNVEKALLEFDDLFKTGQVDSWRLFEDYIHPEALAALDEAEMGDAIAALVRNPDATADDIRKLFSDLRDEIDVRRKSIVTDDIGQAWDNPAVEGTAHTVERMKFPEGIAKQLDVLAEATNQYTRGYYDVLKEAARKAAMNGGDAKLVDRVDGLRQYGQDLFHKTSLETGSVTDLVMGTADDPGILAKVRKQGLDPVSEWKKLPEWFQPPPDDLNAKNIGDYLWEGNSPKGVRTFAAEKWEAHAQEVLDITSDLANELGMSDILEQTKPLVAQYEAYRTAIFTKNGEIRSMAAANRTAQVAREAEQAGTVLEGADNIRNVARQYNIASATLSPAGTPVSNDQKLLNIINKYNLGPKPVDPPNAVRDLVQARTTPRDQLPAFVQDRVKQVAEAMKADLGIGRGYGKQGKGIAATSVAKEGSTVGRPGEKVVVGLSGSENPQWFRDMNAAGITSDKKKVYAALEKIIEGGGKDKANLKMVNHVRDIIMDTFQFGDEAIGLPPDVAVLKHLNASDEIMNDALGMWQDITGQRVTMDEALKQMGYSKTGIRPGEFTDLKDVPPEIAHKAFAEHTGKAYVEEVAEVGSLKSIEDFEPKIKQQVKGASYKQLKQFEKEMLKDTDSQLGKAAQTYLTEITNEIENMPSDVLRDLYNQLENVDMEKQDAYFQILKEWVETKGVRIPPPYPDGQTPSMARAMAENSEGWLEAINDAETKMLERFGYKVDSPYTPQMQDAMKEFAKESVDKSAEAAMVAQKTGQYWRDFALLPYGETTHLDHALSYIFPYQFWYSRSYKTWMQRLASDPQILAGYAKLKDAMAKVHKDSPEWWKYNVKLPEFMWGLNGGNPMYLNLEASVWPLYGLTGVDFNEPRKRVNTLTATLDDMGKFGPSVWAPINVAMAALMQRQGEDEAARYWGSRIIPQTQTIKSIQSMLGGTPKEYDPAVQVFSGKGMFDTSAQDPYEEKRTGRALAAMSQEGIPEEQLQQAAYDRSGPLWDEAKLRATRLRAPGQIASFFGGVGFKARTPEDMEIDQFYGDMYRLMSMRDADLISSQQYTAAWDDMRNRYPFMDVLLMSRKAGQYRDEAYVWNVINRIPPGSSREVYEAMDIDPETANKFYENKGDLSFMSDSEKKDFMNKIVQVGAVLAVPPDATREQWNGAKDAYKNMQTQIKQMYGEKIYEGIDAFYSLTDTDQKKAYLESNPAVEAAMNAQDWMVTSDPVLREFYGGIDTLERYLYNQMYDTLEDRYGKETIDANARYATAKYQMLNKELADQILSENPKIRNLWADKDVMKQELWSILAQFGANLPEAPKPVIRGDVPDPMSPQQQRLTQEQPQLMFSDYVNMVGPVMSELVVDFTRGEEIPKEVMDELDYLAPRNGFKNGDDLLIAMLIAYMRGQ